MMVPENVRSQQEELIALCNRHTYSLPVIEVARFLHISPESLRTSILQGRCPFAMGWKKDMANNAAFIIPPLSFYLWMTVGGRQVQGGDKSE